MKIGIGAIFKNEEPYILEWVAHHRALGFDRFILADNESSDGTLELLRKLERIGLAKVLRVAGRAMQLPTYRDIVSNHASGLDWIAFLDADEFIIPTGKKSVRTILTEADKDVGAIVMNWACYGSSGHQAASPRGVLPRFTKRADKDFPANRHYKSIVRPQAVKGYPCSHAAHLNEGYRTTNALGNNVAPSKDMSIAGGDVHWGGLRVNHYVIKSKEEFIARKLPRGRASVDEGLPNPETYFASFDRNEVSDPVSWMVRARTALHLAFIKARLARMSQS